jgi:transformation/transcription domain-associated protein
MTCAISPDRVSVRKKVVLQETSRRFLHFTVPRVVAVSPQMRLIEDNPASVSLLDIYKQGCARVGLEHDSPVLRYYERLAAVQVKFLNT